MKKEYHLTKDGVDELKQELEDLKSQRAVIADKLKTARGYGDLSENSEYHNARDEQAKLETRVTEIEHILQNVTVISNPKNQTEVELGNTVYLKNSGKDEEYTIVGSVEANPAEKKISDESPIGKALLGKKVGDKVEIDLPSGSHTYTIKQIK